MRWRCGMPGESHQVESVLRLGGRSGVRVRMRVLGAHREKHGMSSASKSSDAHACSATLRRRWAIARGVPGDTCAVGRSADACLRQCQPSVDCLQCTAPAAVSATGRAKRNRIFKCHWHHSNISSIVFPASPSRHQTVSRATHRAMRSALFVLLIVAVVAVHVTADSEVR